jgi:UDP-glucose 4-epimerase
MSKRVLVTGAGGFVCSHITQALLQHGCQVTALDTVIPPHLQYNWDSQWPGQIQCIEGDHHALPDASFDAVVHGAAITASASEREESPIANLEANVQPILAVLDWSARQQVKRTVLVSSTGVFQRTAPGIVDEDTPPSPVGMYAIAKHMSEVLAQTLRQHHQQDVVVARLGNIYGIGDYPRPTRPRVSLVARLVRQAVQNGVIQVYAPDERRDWTFAPNIGDCVHNLLAAPRLAYSLYQLIGPETLTTLEIATHIQRSLPGTELVIHPETEPGIPPLTRLGTFSGARFEREMEVVHWTPFSSAIATVIAEHAQQMEAV